MSYLKLIFKLKIKSSKIFVWKYMTNRYYIYELVLYLKSVWQNMSFLIEITMK